MDKTAVSQATTQKPLNKNLGVSVGNLNNIHELNLDEQNLNKSHSQLNNISMPDNLSGIEEPIEEKSER